MAELKPEFEKLKNWITENKLTPYKFGKKYGIPEKTVTNYVRGDVKEIKNLKNKKILYDVTGIDYFKLTEEENKKFEKLTNYGKDKKNSDIDKLLNYKKDHKKKECPIDYNKFKGKEDKIDELVKEVSELVKKVKENLPYSKTKILYNPSIEDRVSNVSGLFNNIMDELEYFKKCPPEDRKKLINAIPEEDAGYLTAFLSAMYQDTKFKAWVLNSMYIRNSRHKK